MTLASGQQAGKSYGIDGSSFEIGNEASCDVSVVDESGTDHPTGVASQGRRLRVERGSSGWSIRDLNGIGFFVNQSYVRSTSELRSGDIVRLTWKGPDVQFLLQSSSQSLNRLVEQYLPAGDRQADDSASNSSAESPKTSTNDLRKTTRLSREALSAVHTFQENKRQSRPPMTWLLAVAALVIVVLLLTLVYMIVGMG